MGIMCLSVVNGRETEGYDHGRWWIRISPPVRWENDARLSQGWGLLVGRAYRIHEICIDTMAGAYK